MAKNKKGFNMTNIKKILVSTMMATSLLIPTVSSASQAKGLNVLINSGDSQTQAMAMVLSLMTIKKHKKM